MVDKRDEGRMTMMIDRLGGIDPLKNVQNTQKTHRAKESAQPDSINVSDEARLRAEVFQAMEAVGSAPDVRSERVAEVIKKIEDPAYINNAVVDIVADRLMDVFGV